MVWEAEGRESSIALVGDGGYAFLVNGKSDGHARADAGAQGMGGLLGALIHPEVHDVCVIGLGTGSTAGWLARVPTVRRVDVVELEPAVRQVAAFCAGEPAGAGNPSCISSTTTREVMLIAARGTT